MIRRKMVVIISVFLILLINRVGIASDQTKLYLDAVNLYNNGKYAASVAAFEKIAEDGIRNGQLFYNLGNAHFKNGELGKSIAWYERALILAPNDPDLKFNYKHVKGFVKDKSEDGKSSVVKVLFFWKDLLSLSAIKWLAVFFFFLFWLLVTIRIIKGRKPLKIHTGIVFTIALVFILTALYDYYTAHYVKKAVILPDEVSVRSGLTDDSTELFILHVGSKVRVEENRKEYVKIRFSDDKIGWVSKETLEII